MDLASVLDAPGQPGLRMTRRYDVHAIGLLRGDGWLFPQHADPADTGLLSRPPGYPIFLSWVYSAAGRSFATVQLVQNLLHAVTPVLVFLLAGRLLAFRLGAAAGLLAALAPHFAYYSNLILPDALCVLPVLGAVLCLESAWRRRDRKALWILAGVAFGVSVWLRPNTLVLAPFVAAGLVALRPTLRTARRAALMALSSCLVVAPITIRNYVIYGQFVPVSINMGIVLWEGIADAGGEQFGAEKTDRRVARQEARLYRDPRYSRWWASPDGIRRDRDRVKRSLAVIRAHPAWFLGAMLGRMGQMLDYASAAPPLVGTPPEPPRREPDEDAAGSGDGGVSDRWPAAESPAGLAPRLSDSTCLLPGRALAWSVPLVAAVQALESALLLGLLIIGAAGVAFVAPRRAAFVALVPLAYLLFQSAMHLEFRVTLPMHALLCVFAAAPLALLVGVVTGTSRGR